MRKFSFFLIEQKDNTPKRGVTGHLIHVSDRLIHGDAHETLRSIRSMSDHLSNIPSKSNKFSVKADGGMSAVVGKKDGKIFVKYKGVSSPEFYSIADLKRSGKEHYVTTLGPLLKRAKEMNIDDNTAFQLDMMFTNRDNKTIQPNTIKYNLPDEGKIGIAPHKQFKIVGDEFHAIEDAPDIKQLHHPEVHVADLATNNKRYKKMKQSRSEDIMRDMNLLDSHLSDENFVKFSNSLQDNKKLHTMLQGYLNKDAREKGEVSLDDFRKFIPDYIQRRKVGIKTKHQEHIDHHNFVNDNEDHFHTLFSAHNASTRAMHSMLDHLGDNHHVTNLNPMEGHEHEGMVHTDENGVMSKFVRRGPQGFAAKNAARTEELRSQVQQATSKPKDEYSVKKREQQVLSKVKDDKLSQKRRQRGSLRDRFSSFVRGSAPQNTPEKVSSSSPSL